MDSIKDALTQAGNLVQQAAHTVVEAIRGGENEESKNAGDTPDKNIDSKQRKFDKEQDATLQKSEITASSGGYQDPAPKVNHFFSNRRYINSIFRAMQKF